MQRAVHVARFSASACGPAATPKHVTATTAALPGGPHGPLWHIALAGPSTVHGHPLHALVVFRDGYTTVLEGTRPVWAREEALTCVEQIEFVDLPKRSVILDNEADDVEEGKARTWAWLWGRAASAKGVGH